MIYRKPIFEVITGDKHYKIFANGTTEGFDEPHRIINRTSDHLAAMLPLYDSASNSLVEPTPKLPYERSVSHRTANGDESGSYAPFWPPGTGSGK